MEVFFSRGEVIAAVLEEEEHEEDKEQEGDKAILPKQVDLVEARQMDVDGRAGVIAE